MKKKPIWPLILLMLLLISALLALGVFLALRLNTLSGRHDDRPVFPPEMISETGPSGDEGLPERSVLSESEAPSSLSGAAGRQVIFVGDSRTIGMRNALIALDRPDECVYCGKSGEGYTWFQEEGCSLMEKAIAEHPGLPVVLNLGVNDLEALDNYLSAYARVEKKYPDTSFYYMSVNPVTVEYEHVSNELIDSFNQALSASFPHRFIDTNTWMEETGFDSVDGIHYSEETYCAIHDYVLRALS